MFGCRTLVPCLALAALMSHQCEVKAADLPPTLQIHGFLSPAFIRTSENNFFGASSDEGSWDFAELGLNGSWQPRPDLQIGAQVLSRHAGEGDDGEPRLDYGMADYRLVSTEEGDGGLRVGRIKNPLGLYNETRDVAFTRPSIILPQSIYFDRTRNLALSADGVQIYGDHRLAEDDLSWQLEAALPPDEDEDTETTLLGGNRVGELDSRRSYIGRLLYEIDGGRLRFAYTQAQLNLHYSDDPSGTGSIRFEPAILSGQYNSERWSITSEYALRTLEFDQTIPYALPGFRKLTGESYYVQGTYQLAPMWRTLLRYDVTYLNKDDRNGQRLETATGGLRPAHSQFAKDWTVGLEWNPHRMWLVRTEYHWVDGTAWLPVQDNPVAAATERRWRMFALQVSFGF